MAPSAPTPKKDDKGAVASQDDDRDDDDDDVATVLPQTFEGLLNSFGSRMNELAGFARQANSNLPVAWDGEPANAHAVSKPGDGVNVGARNADEAIGSRKCHDERGEQDEEQDEEQEGEEEEEEEEDGSQVQDSREMQRKALAAISCPGAGHAEYRAVATAAASQRKRKPGIDQVVKNVDDIGWGAPLFKPKKDPEKLKAERETYKRKYEEERKLQREMEEERMDGRSGVLGLRAKSRGLGSKGTAVGSAVVNGVTGGKSGKRKAENHGAGEEDGEAKVHPAVLAAMKAMEEGKGRDVGEDGDGDRAEGSASKNGVGESDGSDGDDDGEHVADANGEMEKKKRKRKNRGKRKNKKKKRNNDGSEAAASTTAAVAVG
ncbi:hypothetical protein MKZ38_007915 [Zalerion maritima]|uniref:Uncharacterized protein n=1 Tax=Zalerion maritima TaxID=339359 RepID=A0AAD5WPG1_9PEZI|nr:hypothetical protein MKZ38_007915 [Zalerion maritima]